ncbi:MAG: cellulase family glycosylhydrolase [Bacteroidales bacterium]|nr:cellulase family glycosylhydrolase [Bacteroidales bacterium]MBN2764145.1 cellulase family glycosylhydrolase [Bacteroidales bacterium]
MTIIQIYRNLKWVLSATALIFMISCKQPASETITNPSGFAIMRGVNLSHWLSQDFGWEPKYAYINENDIRFIDSIGYDHVRIPVDEMELWDTAGKPNEVAFGYLTGCLDWCAKFDLKAIVDLHIVRAHHFNAANEGGTNILWTDSTAQNNLINIWEQLSERLRHYPNDMVAYEILNEAVAPDPGDWNRLLNKAIKTIRKSEPDRVIIAGGNMWQIPENLKYLEVPEDDRNIILSFHTYTPLAFTHYKADWTAVRDYHGPVHYPGQIIKDEDYEKYVDTTNAALVEHLFNARDTFNIERLFEVIRPGIEYAKSKNLQLYCGEFGCLPTVDRKDRMQYYSDMITALEDNNIAWCNWEYKGDFGIYHFDMETKKSLYPDWEFISVLLKRD